MFKNNFQMSSTDKKKNNILKLPNSLIIFILNYLDLGSKAQISYVNKTFNLITKNLPLDYISCPIIMTNINKLLSNINNERLIGLNIKMDSNISSIENLNKCTNLRRLILDL